MACIGRRSLLASAYRRRGRRGGGRPADPPISGTATATGGRPPFPGPLVDGQGPVAISEIGSPMRVQASPVPDQANRPAQDAP